ncbi:MAG: DUF4214 domain-containing protein, partial [Candidatus Methylomirabilis sp.]
VKQGEVQLVILAYIDLLQRPPDDAGLEAWTRELANGLSEAELREAIRKSEEYQVKCYGKQLPLELENGEPGAHS